MRRWVWLTVLLLVASAQAKAQSDVPRVEVGVQGSVINTPPNRFHRETFGGFGGRVTINLTPAIAVEGQVDYYPEDITNRPTANNEFRDVKPDLTGLFGIKAGLRREKFGVFGKLRPGFARFSPIQDCSSISNCPDVRTTGVGLDVGGAVEGYISRRFMVRFDVGDTYLHLRKTQFLVADVSGTFLDTRDAEGRHNLQVSVGVGFRF
jgi:outer membrane protein with beta-barrel domain